MSRDHGLECSRNAVSFGEAAGHSVLKRQQLLGAPGTGDVLRDPAVAAKLPFVVEDGLTAGADGAHFAP